MKKSSLILPNDGLYITRKRKKWKFAHFDSYPNCFSYLSGDNAGEIYQNIKSTFLRSERGNVRNVVLEIAAGNAQFSLQLAKLHPEQDFIAIDIKSDRLYTSAKQALEEGVTNIAFLRMPLTELSQAFPKESVDEIWLTFPDPHPKKRSAKHRLSGQAFLRLYRNILKDTGKLKFKTDNQPLFLWSLEQFVAEKWHIEELSFDLHTSALPEEYKIMTYYEARFTDEGLTINYCTTSR